MLSTLRMHGEEKPRHFICRKLACQLKRGAVLHCCEPPRPDGKACLKEWAFFYWFCSSFWMMSLFFSYSVLKNRSKKKVTSMVKSRSRCKQTTKYKQCSSGKCKLLYHCFSKMWIDVWVITFSFICSGICTLFSSNNHSLNEILSELLLFAIW